MCLSDQYMKRLDVLGTYKQRLNVLQDTWELVDTQIQVYNGIYIYTVLVEVK
jgi:hypothetical protein